MQIEHSFDTMRTRIEDMTALELERALSPPAAATKSEGSLWSKLFGAKPKPAAPQPLSRQEREFELINSFKQRGLDADDAAPIRGSIQGASEDRLTTSVEISHAQSQQQ